MADVKKPMVTRMMAMMSERLCDLEAVEFHYRRNPYCINLKETFVPSSTGADG